MTTQVRVALSAAAIPLLLVACGDAVGPRVPTSISADPLSLDLQIGDTTRISAQVVDQQGSPIAAPEGTAITWRSSNNAVALVQNGLVLGVGEGTANIIAEAEGLQAASVPVVVTAPLLTGQIGFDYTGHRSGAFELASTFSLLMSGPTEPSFVVTFHDPEWNTHDIFAWREHADGTIDVAWFWVNAEVTAPTTRPVEEGFIIFGYNGPTIQPDGIYGTTDGSITFTAIAGRQFNGTFTLQLIDQGDNVLTVQNGTFSAPWIPAFLIVGGAQASAHAAAGSASAPRSAATLRHELRALREQFSTR